MPTEPTVGTARRGEAVLTIDLAAIRSNYRRLCQEAGDSACAAVVKADAYGLGLETVAPALAKAGAERFFVAQLNEAITLRKLLPAAEIYVLNGLIAGAEGDYPAHGLRPVLNSLDEVARYAALARDRERALPAALHVDTGMNRLGLPADELDRLAAEPQRLDGIALAYVISHLACAEERDHPLNAGQLAAFVAARARLPATPASFANSSGIFLGADYHFDLCRPGVALYGVNPTPDQPNPMAQVVRLQGKILQIRAIDAPQSVGYGALFQAGGRRRIATVGVGYADGYLRSLSNRGQALIGGERVPVVGRISMDLLTLDVSSLPEAKARPGTAVELIGGEQDVDALARQAGSIGYEMLTALGRRYHRVYLDA